VEEFSAKKNSVPDFNSRAILSRIGYKSLCILEIVFVHPLDIICDL